jgi:integrase
LKLAKSWRLTYPNKRVNEVENLSPNTVLKWSKALQAAFQRANVNAGKTCVRGVVDESKLLSSNPWMKFGWIEGRGRPKRQFSNVELLSILDFCGRRWKGVSTLTAAVKLALWTAARVSEISNLSWGSLKKFGHEEHFEIIGKWGVEKWARIPEGLMNELRGFQSDNGYVFNAYNKQLRQFYLASERPQFAALVKAEYSPKAFADWFQDAITDWAKSTSNSHASPHAFRKTSLQHALSGESLNQSVAQDARITASVMMGHYVSEGEIERRMASNRMFQRILASLTPELAIQLK